MSQSIQIRDDLYLKMKAEKGERSFSELLDSYITKTPMEPDEQAEEYFKYMGCTGWLYKAILRNTAEYQEKTGTSVDDASAFIAYILNRPWPQVKADLIRTRREKGLPKNDTIHTRR